ncbi:MAG: hypothetical protein GAK33_05591 [Burkholderia lata]|uniref:Uncharacterized protein n=1 Tax=Burkholderia lata (strain ATCC 17760 / DSM 23089 / LMG 22485 / NCIMB 9086 / R18194 / 383) TaxID=482957 RepID=A0A833PPX9_BURL3|nr:hypothetical protein [Burkholderia lata]KAF1034510.1 MAG: hypothetical protein GAK33_05591 [Burkholderia lata]
MRRLDEFRRARIVAERDIADLHHPQPDARFAIVQDFNSKKRSACLRLAAYIAVMNLTHGM